MGAGIGAGAGALASVIGVMVTRGKPTVVYPEMALVFRLTTPVTISTEQSAAAFQPVTQQDFSQPGLIRRGPPAAPYGAPPPPYYSGYAGYGYPYPAYGYPAPYYYGPGFGIGFGFAPGFYYRGGPRYYRRW
jgi:hypothetical protein